MVRGRLLTLVGITLLVLAPGYVTAQQSGKSSAPPATQSPGLGNKPEPASAPLKTYTPAEKQAYQQKMATDLKKLQEKIDDLKLKGRTVDQHKKRMTMRALITLQNKANAARNKLAALEKAAAADWSKLKADMDKAVADLARTYQDVEALIG
jgi:hypothetical protein